MDCYLLLPAWPRINRILIFRPSENSGAKAIVQLSGTQKARSQANPAILGSPLTPPAVNAFEKGVIRILRARTIPPRRSGNSQPAFFDHPGTCSSSLRYHLTEIAAEQRSANFELCCGRPGPDLSLHKEPAARCAGFSMSCGVHQSGAVTGLHPAGVPPGTCTK